jgi:hypothetical protein
MEFDEHISYFANQKNRNLPSILQEYRDLCKIHKTFRERSENADVATEIRLDYFLYLHSIFGSPM